MMGTGLCIRDPLSLGEVKLSGEFGDETVAHFFMPLWEYVMCVGAGWVHAAVKGTHSGCDDVQSAVMM